MHLFTPADFKIFDLEGFQERMDAIRTRIRPKLASIGEAIAPELSAAVDQSLHVHVARHARRTVNPPDDTWAAFGADPRGYKKDVHFRVAVSRNCVRLLFEAGPEYYAKDRWSRAWRREHADILKGLAAASGLGLFRDEHDEDPAAEIEKSTDGAALSRALTSGRDGQLVIGRRIKASDLTRMKPVDFQKAAMSTFTALVPLFKLCEPRSTAVKKKTAGS